MSPKVIDVKTLDDYKLFITFENGKKKIFDVKPYLEYEVFKPMTDVKKFDEIFIDFGTIC